MNVEEDSTPPATPTSDEITNKRGIGETLKEEDISGPKYKDGSTKCPHTALTIRKKLKPPPPRVTGHTH
jgi:hypothetical protein